jgi:hypothetical protein
MRTSSQTIILGAAAMAAAVTPAASAAAAPQTLPKPRAHHAKLDGKRHGSFPSAPKVRLDGRTQRAPRATRVRRNRRPNRKARRAPVRKPGKARASINGWHGPYANKLAWVIYYVDNYNRRILGGYYRQPWLYPDAAKYAYFNCGGYIHRVVNNAEYCPASNYIAWDTNWYQAFFNNPYGGDMSVAAVHAHEWGHATQSMLYLRSARLGYSLYRELYADCMSGSFGADMYRRGNLDNLGVGDPSEALNVMSWLGDNRANRTHGTSAERQAFFRYGWIYGPQACVNWALS